MSQNERNILEETFDVVRRYIKTQFATGKTWRDVRHASNPANFQLLAKRAHRLPTLPYRLPMRHVVC